MLACKRQVYFEYITSAEECFVFVSLLIWKPFTPFKMRLSSFVFNAMHGSLYIAFPLTDVKKDLSPLSFSEQHFLSGVKLGVGCFFFFLLFFQILCVVEHGVHCTASPVCLPVQVGEDSAGAIGYCRHCPKELREREREWQKKGHQIYVFKTN